MIIINNNINSKFNNNYNTLFEFEIYLYHPPRHEYLYMYEDYLRLHIRVSFVIRSPYVNYRFIL